MLRVLGPRALPDAGHVHGPAEAVQRVHGPGGGQLQLPQLRHHQPGALSGRCGGRRGRAVVVIDNLSVRGGNRWVTHCYLIPGVLILSMLDSVHRRANCRFY